MNKIILAYYINVGNLDEQGVQEYLEKLRETIKSDSNDIIQYFIAVREQETKVECVYPKYIKEDDDVESFEDVIKRLEEQVKQVENKLKDEG